MVSGVDGVSFWSGLGTWQLLDRPLKDLFMASSVGLVLSEVLLG